MTYSEKIITDLSKKFHGKNLNDLILYVEEKYNTNLEEVEDSIYLYHCTFKILIHFTKFSLNVHCEHCEGNWEICKIKYEEV